MDTVCIIWYVLRRMPYGYTHACSMILATSQSTTSQYQIQLVGCKIPCEAIRAILEVKLVHVYHFCQILSNFVYTKIFASYCFNLEYVLFFKINHLADINVSLQPPCHHSLLYDFTIATATNKIYYAQHNLYGYVRAARDYA